MAVTGHAVGDPMDAQKSRTGMPRLMVDMLAGMTGGLVTSMLFYPLESLEVRLQSGQLTAEGRKRKLPVALVVRNIIAQEGCAALYKGLTPTTLAGTVNWGCYLPIYEFTKYWWAGEATPTTGAFIIGSMASGFITTFIVNPILVVRVRMATASRHTQEYRTIGSTLQHIIHNEGVRGLWKGVGPSLVGISEGMIQFSVYEELKGLLHGAPGVYVWCGLLSKVVATGIAYPYLVIRSSLQADPCPYSCFTDCISKIYVTEGMKGFYKGIVPNLSRQLLPAALVFHIVESVRHMLQSI